ncbi:hypothetical protein B7486_70635, partial [cyanobacterium TDX16]
MDCRGTDNLEGFGVIVPPGDVAALADAAEALLLDPARRARMSAEGLEHARRDLRWAAAIDELERHFGLVPPSKPGSVAVLMPSMDRPHLIGRALDSLLAQTRADWTLTLALNGLSEDHRKTGYPLALATYLDDPRITVIDAPETGIPQALNAALAVTPPSDYLAVLEDDDEWHPEFLASLTAALDRNPWAGMAYCDLDEQGVLLPLTRPPRHG